MGFPQRKSISRQQAGKIDGLFDIASRQQQFKGGGGNISFLGSFPYASPSFEGFPE